jgi:hypothetical protein
MEQPLGQQQQRQPQPQPQQERHWQQELQDFSRLSYRYHDAVARPIAVWIRRATSDFKDSDDIDDDDDDDDDVDDNESDDDDESASNNNDSSQQHILRIDGSAYEERPAPRHCYDDTRIHVSKLPPMNRRSLQYLVDFLSIFQRRRRRREDESEEHRPSDDDEPVVITHLVLYALNLTRHPNDGSGGLDVLRTFFARSDSTTTLTKVTLWHCDFGTVDEALQLLASFQTNPTVVDLEIVGLMPHLDNAALGACLSNPDWVGSFQRLELTDCSLVPNGVRVFQPVLQANRTLKELILDNCDIGDEEIRLIADALFGNTTMDALCVSDSYITDVGLADGIVRIIDTTRLKTFDFATRNHIFDEVASNKRLAEAVEKNVYLQELPGITHPSRPERPLPPPRLRPMAARMSATVWYRCLDAATIDALTDCLVRNKSLNHVDLLLSAPAPPVHQQQQQQRPQPDSNHGVSRLCSTTATTTTTTMMMKTCHKAITKFAKIRDKAGASAIFKLWIARPQLLERRLEARPPPPQPAAAAAAAASNASTLNHPSLPMRKRSAAAACAAPTEHALKKITP